ncbi:zinc-dependent alcohol dehydrogenase family protein [Caldinitratiruptor microaerophilus]|uniref:Alcohol dehydrogenase n=1 Tax=Caldinitratiruptor microaerophilus TaxID=671077 RepID=A0AA35CII9_9FIRM|nr:zinc-dependent alcohol dehydrogenase family protein [Caldinitratiruptor microaerophilus]BDG59805.1 alcohol dehydrogenase [Caldinitratiruptor microaerophilus]
MKAVVYHGPGKKAWETVPDPAIEKDTDVIVRVTTTTICGTDLHILKGDVPETAAGTILGHEAVGVVEEVGAGVRNFRKGDRVIIPAITACGQCEYCKRGMYSHCLNGGWILGHTVNGLQAQFARVPFADTSLYKVPEGLRDEDVLFLTDILPTAYECGVLNGRVGPGDTVVVVGAGPVGLAAVMLSRLYSPAAVIAVDLDARRLERARRLGADVTVQSDREDPVEVVRKYTGGRGADVAIEAVGIPATFELCTELVGPGGRIANIGVHGKPVTLHLEKLWAHNVTITTRLVDTETISQLMKLIASKRIDPTPLASHTFRMDEFMKAYEVFGQAAANDAVKVVVKQ